jgi:hypothetical protein
MQNIHWKKDDTGTLSVTFIVDDAVRTTQTSSTSGLYALRKMATAKTASTCDWSSDIFTGS